MRLLVCLLLLVVLACTATADSNPLYRSKHLKLDPLVPLSHCTRLGPRGEFVLEWELSLAPKWTLEVRYTSDIQKGYSALGLANDTKQQIILGYPIENVHCSRALFDNYSPFDIYGNVYPNFPEVPGKVVWTNDSHVVFYMMRNLSISSRKFIDKNREGGTIKIKVLWAFMQQSLFNAGCYMGNLYDLSELTTYELSLTSDEYRKVNGICKEYTGMATSTGELVKEETDPVPLLNEINQNHRVAILFVGGNMLLDAGQSPPSFAESGYVVAGDDGNNVCSSTAKRVTARWSGFSDPNGGITKYVATIGTPERPSLYYDRLDMKTALSLSLPADMEPNTTYIVTVTAYNFAGLSTSRSSNEVFVLNDGQPIAAEVFPGPIPDPEKAPRYQKDTNHFRVSWKGWLKQERQRYVNGNWVDNEVMYSMHMVGGPRTPFSTVQYSPNGFVASYSMVHGNTYFIEIQIKNCAGTYTHARTSGVTIDTKPPSGGSVWFGNGTATKPQSNYSIYAPIRLSWADFTDPLSGMGTYTWALAKTASPPSNADSSYIYKWEDVGFATTVSKPSINETLGTVEAKKLLNTKIYFFLKVQDLLGNEQIFTVPNEGVPLIVPQPEGEEASPASPGSPGPAAGAPAGGAAGG